MKFIVDNIEVVFKFSSHVYHNKLQLIVIQREVS